MNILEFSCRNIPGIGDDRAEGFEDLDPSGWP